MNIETVNELIASLENAGELSIREQKFLKLAKAFKQLAAENVALKAAHPQPFGSEMMKALEAYEWHQEDCPESGMLDAYFILRDSIRIQTPATDRIVAGIKADGVALVKSAFEEHIQSPSCYQDEVVGMESALSIASQVESQLREGADK
ncbi:hypothetical protein [Klebsiella pneumoniae]|uniref:hypothetical protein n=1 Tax=Klebsiella pneumoniae TaxID=573 RepID=UPI0010E8254E|nr:hypothetical protein [Klebsiella pneumoniae]VGA54221.1 Uncharacterised protein [Klebsiella pneumoniae]